MAAPINKTIESNTYKVLKIWVERLSHDDIYFDYIEWLHDCIKQGNHKVLTEYEDFLLRCLFKLKIINKDNLLQYVIDFPEICPKFTFLGNLYWWFSDAEILVALNPSKTLLENDTLETDKRKKNFNIKYEIQTKLKTYNFKKAEELYLESNGALDLQEYLNSKKEYIGKYFTDSYTYKNQPLKFDDEQTEAIATPGNSILIKARAGSGKTQVIAGKIMFLLEKEDIKPEEIAVLAFNRDVPEEVHTRLCKGLILKSDPDKYKNIDVARTFHSLAVKIVGGHLKILVDEGTNGGARSQFIKKIINDLKESDEEFRNFVYEFFRGSSEQDSIDSCKNKDEYFEYLRNLKYKSLKGEDVKSFGEKIIADFLFEHSVEYQYEHRFSPGSCKTDFPFYNQKLRNLPKHILPDFYLPKQHLVWEHWAIDEDNTSNSEKAKFNKIFSISWDEYHRRMKEKIWFWGDWRKRNLNPINEDVKEIIKINKLIETRSSQLSHGREVFEKHIEKMLSNNSVDLVKRDPQEVAEELWNKNKDLLTKRLISFIDRYQQQAYPSRDDFLIKLDKYKNNKWVYSFLLMGLKVLDLYIKKQSESEGLIDFNQLVGLATQKVKNGEANQTIQNLKWILIDEYQDFSPLFFEMIKELKKRNQELKIFCVGDNWQAINGFAGADTRFFDNFDGFFPDGIAKTISTNYRSSADIVNVTSNFMIKNDFEGKVAIPFKKDTGTDLIVEEIEKTNIQYLLNYSNPTPDDIFLRQFEDYRKGKTLNPKAVRYLKRICQLLEENSAKEVLFLNMRNTFLKQSLSWWSEKVERIMVEKGIYPNWDIAREHFKFKTMHKSKGLEADIVVLLEIERGKFPYYHPDNRLFEIFGDDITKISAEQKRLFYVAMTRGKEKTYIITSSRNKSEYLDKIITSIKD